MKHTGRNILVAVVILIIAFLIAPFRNGESVDLNVTGNSLTVSGPEDFSFTVDVDQIDRIELVELTDMGTAAEDGGETKSLYWGNWENDAWGRYTLCVSKRSDTAILITTVDDRRYVFNYESDETTMEMRQALLDYVEERTT